MASRPIHALPTGTDIDGYEIQSVLGAGGFGITYKAVERPLGREVAIKEYLPKGIATREADSKTVVPIDAGSESDFAWGLDRFRQEAEVLNALHHPNIVPVLRYIETNGTAYIVMAYQRGESLGTILKKYGGIEESEVLELIHPLLDGLEIVHKAGFLHRDIKPDNIFIREDGSPVLLDFGAARQALGQHSNSLTAIVSEGFAPFEQYQSGDVQTAATDIYAIGAVMYCSVTGARPKDAPSRVSAILSGGEDPMTPASELVEGRCSDQFLAAIDSALAVMEPERPQSIRAFRTMLPAMAPASSTSHVASAVEALSKRKANTVEADKDRRSTPAEPAAEASAQATPKEARTPARSRVLVPAAALLVFALVGGAGAMFLTGEDEAGTVVDTQAETATRRQAAAESEAERQRQAEIEAERQRQAEAEAERQRQAEAEAERQRQAEAEAERRRRAEQEAEAERRRQAAAEAERERIRSTTAASSFDEARNRAVLGFPFESTELDASGQQAWQRVVAVLQANAGATARMIFTQDGMEEGDRAYRARLVWMIRQLAANDIARDRVRLLRGEAGDGPDYRRILIALTVPDASPARSQRRTDEEAARGQTADAGSESVSSDPVAEALVGNYYVGYENFRGTRFPRCLRVVSLEGSQIVMQVLAGRSGCAVSRTVRTQAERQGNSVQVRFNVSWGSSSETMFLTIGSNSVSGNTNYSGNRGITSRRVTMRRR